MPIEFMFVRSDFFSNPILLIMNKIKNPYRRAFRREPYCIFSVNVSAFPLLYGAIPKGDKGEWTEVQKGKRVIGDFSG